jgi:hypothetical protein
MGSPTRTAALLAAGICTRHIGHTGPCNGLPREDGDGGVCHRPPDFPTRQQIDAYDARQAGWHEARFTPAPIGRKILTKIDDLEHGARNVDTPLILQSVMDDDQPTAYWVTLAGEMIHYVPTHWRETDAMLEAITSETPSVHITGRVMRFHKSYGKTFEQVMSDAAPIAVFGSLDGASPGFDVKLCTRATLRDTVTSFMRSHTDTYAALEKEHQEEMDSIIEWMDETGAMDFEDGGLWMRTGLQAIVDELVKLCRVRFDDRVYECKGAYEAGVKERAAVKKYKTLVAALGLALGDYGRKALAAAL